MRTNVYGRNEELKLLNEAYVSTKAELSIVFGRRRVGKSYLVKYFAKSKLALLFEGLEGENTVGQIRHFQNQLKKQIENPLLQKARFESWSEIFDFLTTYLADHSDQKVILFFDEFQWMAAGQSKLIALLKHYWDNYWKNENVYLILCGSIASFMVRKVLRSKALYGRMTQQLQIRKLKPHVLKQFFQSRRSKEEMLRYLLVLGGVPKYWEDINLNRSFEKNIQALFFDHNALYLEEFERIFNVHFREPSTYLRIIKLLEGKTLNLDEIAKGMAMKSGGGLKVYIENLEMAEFIRSLTSFDSKESKYPKYKISDEFCWFFIKYVRPHLRLIREGGGAALFNSKIVSQWDSWFGYAFENYCINNALLIAEWAEFKEKVESFGPYYRKSSPGVQVDLLFKRTDKVITICEMKYRNKKITTEIIVEMNTKISKLTIPKGYTLEKLLIAPNGASEELLKSQYFNKVITLDDFFKDLY